MSRELRTIDMAHGLLLLLLLAAPFAARDLMPWGMEALFILAGFHLRLVDRRFALRGEARDWISHILMKPARLLRWAAMAAVAFLTLGRSAALGVLIAALLCEMLLYPVGTLLLGRRPLSWSALALALLLLVAGLTGAGLLHHMLGFMAGLTACLVWLRGPDGEPRALALALGGGTAAAAMPLLVPAAMPFAAPVATVCAAWTLAHLSALRRRPMAWRLNPSPIGIP